MNENTIINDKTYVGSLCNDAVIAINKDGQLVHATCHPSRADECIKYSDSVFQLDLRNVTSVKFSKGALIYKITG